MQITYLLKEAAELGIPAQLLPWWWTRSTRSTRAGVEQLLGVFPEATVLVPLTGDTGEAFVLTRDDYIIRVDADGDFSSAYLCPDLEVPAYGETGWATGYDA